MTKTHDEITKTLTKMENIKVKYYSNIYKTIIIVFQ